MQNIDDHLNDFEIENSETSRVYFFIKRLYLLFIIYVIGLSVYKYLYLQLPISKNFGYQLIFLVATPILFWILFLKGFKTGWFLRLTYYSVFATALIFNFLKKAEIQYELSLTLLLLTLILVATSFLKKILQDFKISNWLILTYFVILALFIFLFYYISFIDIK